MRKLTEGHASVAINKALLEHKHTQGYDTVHGCLHAARELSSCLYRKFANFYTKR